MYKIYVHTTPDGRKYVGCTSLKTYKRFQGGCNYKNCTRFNDAIKFFGWDNIEHKILETVEDKETALKREEYYTLLFRSNEPEFGYNIFVGNIKNEYSRKKHSEKLKGRKQSEDTKKKRSESLKGRKQSEDTINKRIEKIKKPFILKNNKTGEIHMFDSQQSCAKFFGVSDYSVNSFINHKVQSRIFKDYEVLK